MLGKLIKAKLARQAATTTITATTTSRAVPDEQWQRVARAA